MSLQFAAAKILIIDDNPVNLGVLVDYLIKYGFEVLTARNGPNGLEKAAYVLPDLILLDIVMTGLDGFETCRRLKANPITQDIPVIFLTSLTSTQDKIKGFEAGGVDYITKPLHQAEVLARITTHLQLRTLTRELHQANAKLAQQVHIAQATVRDLAYRNALIGQAVEASSDAVVMGNRAAEITYTNSTFSKLFGYTLTDLQARGGLPAIFVNAAQAQAMQTAIRQQQFWQGEVNLQTQSRQTVTAIVRTSCTSAEAGGGWVSLMTDITAHRQALTRLERQRQKLRRLSARLVETQETERRLLAQNLHDRIGQNLFTSDVLLNIIRGQVAPQCTNTPALLAHIDDLSALINQTTTDVRDVMAELHPPMLDDHGLTAALEWYGHQFSKRFGINVTVHGQEPQPRLPASVENALFRITQEALTNVAKHARAATAAITITVEADKAFLQVKDDGIGFNAEASEQEATGDWGWGLATMTERAETVGGQCQVISAPGRGATVLVEVPR